MRHANEIQHGGSHYQTSGGPQHWDFVTANTGASYLMGCATKYLSRWRKKHRYSWLQRVIAGMAGIRLGSPKEDLAKAGHYVQKLIETAMDMPEQVRPITNRRITADEFSKENGLHAWDAQVIRQVWEWENVRDLEFVLSRIESVLQDL